MIIQNSQRTNHFLASSSDSDSDSESDSFSLSASSPESSDSDDSAPSALAGGDFCFLSVFLAGVAGVSSSSDSLSESTSVCTLPEVGGVVVVAAGLAAGFLSAGFLASSFAAGFLGAGFSASLTTGAACAGVGFVICTVLRAGFGYSLFSSFLSPFFKVFSNALSTFFEPFFCLAAVSFSIF